MKSNYENCLAITLKWEGGDVNHPDDPGGKTRWGITQATYDAWRKSRGLSKRSVFQMTRDEMLAIYKTNYWDAVKGDTLAPGVDLATWDYGVNSGPARARSELLKVVGGDDATTVKKLCARRMSFLKGLKTWKTFGKGWSNRVADIEARGVKMALSAVKQPKQVAEALAAEAAKAGTTAQNNANAAVASGAASVTAAVADIDRWVALGILVLLCAGVSFLIWRAEHNKARAEAYQRVATEG